MPINSRQFSLLSQMGISLWQAKGQPNRTSMINSAHHKALNLSAEKSSTKQNIATITYTPSPDLLTIEQLKASQLFLDILILMELSLGEVRIENNVIKLNLLNWQINKQSQITIEHHVISSPSLEEIQKNTTLKRQLWQLLNEHII